MEHLFDSVSLDGLRHPILALAQLYARILALARRSRRLARVIDWLPLVGDLDEAHPRLTALVTYWIVAAPLAFIVVLLLRGE